jgi:hypothetical protein
VATIGELISGNCSVASAGADCQANDQQWAPPLPYKGKNGADWGFGCGSGELYIAGVQGEKPACGVGKTFEMYAPFRSISLCVVENDITAQGSGGGPKNKQVVRSGKDGLKLQELSLCETESYQAHSADDEKWVPAAQCGVSVRPIASGLPLWMGLPFYTRCEESDFGEVDGVKFKGVKIRVNDEDKELLSGQGPAHVPTVHMLAGLGKSGYVKATFTSYLAIQNTAGLYGANIKPQYLPVFGTGLEGGLTASGFADLEDLLILGSTTRSMAKTVPLALGIVLLVLGIVMVALGMKQNKVDSSS